MHPCDDRDPADLQALLAEVKRTAIFYEVPHPSFDPLKPCPGDLVKFGLPPRPDPQIEPERFGFWRKLVTQPEGYPALTFIKADFAWSSAAPPHLQRYNGARSFLDSNSRHQLSSNWSGGYITPKDGLMIVEVQGLWQVPDPFLPAGAGTGADFWSSTWIGLDGQRRYLHASLPQIGTEQRVTATPSGSRTAIKVWWQWWLRDQLRPPVDLPLTVQPGDLIRSQLNVLPAQSPGGPMYVKFFIKNESTGVAVAPVDYPAPMAPMTTGPTPVQLRVSGATAEWVTERPTRFDSDALHELANYHTVLFSECHAAAAVDPSTLPVTQSLAGARLITMFERRASPARTARISTAERHGRQAISTHYLGE